MNRVTVPVDLALKLLQLEGRQYYEIGNDYAIVRRAWLEELMAESRLPTGGDDR